MTDSRPRSLPLTIGNPPASTETAPMTFVHIHRVRIDSPSSGMSENFSAHRILKGSQAPRRLKSAAAKAKLGDASYVCALSVCAALAFTLSPLSGRQRSPEHQRIVATAAFQRSSLRIRSGSSPAPALASRAL